MKTLGSKDVNAVENRLKWVLEKFGLLIALIVLGLVLSVMSPIFLSPANLINVLRQISINGVLAIGVTYVIITGGIDLSLGAVVAVTGVAAAMFAHPGEYSLIVPLVVGIGSGIIIGALIGVLVTKGSVAPFIVTLGLLTICRGLALVFSSGRPISNLSRSFNAIGSGNFIGLPILVIIFILCFVVSVFILRKTKLGRYIYAVGGSEEAARASGINIFWIKMSVYIICSGLAGLAGIMQASRITVGQPNIGVGYELDAIAAVVIGGTSLSGGVGKITGTLIGILIIGILNNGLDLLYVSSYYQQIIKGIIIIGAVLFDSKTKKY